MTILSVLLFLVALVMHQRVLFGLNWRVRLFHALFLLLMGVLLWPVVRGWEKKVQVPIDEHQLGVVLWDASSSMGMDTKRHKEWQERLEKMPLGQVEWMSFSDRLLPPWGDGVKGQGSSLKRALIELEGNLGKLAPDWVWVISDMGFEPPLGDGASWEGIGQYLTILEPSAALEGDVGIEDVIRDPVWYARTSSPVRVRLVRDNSKDRQAVDILFRLNGDLVKTARAQFESGELQAEVVVDLQAKEVGPILMEITIAEGQGGERPENDQWLDLIESLRDRVRILRVVGRPTWSSKYLRDALVKREDVDLVDFHILRSMEDMVMAPPGDLALIPFPVEELFVENIDSFDLVLWQNFNQDQYPFFRPAYLANIRREVKAGAGFLLWSGTLSWRWDRGPLRELAPLVTTGRDHHEVEGALLPTSGELGWPDGLGKALEALPSKKYRVFKGDLQDGARVAMSVGDEPLITLKQVGKGRVAQVLSDRLWTWSFSEQAGSLDLYDEVLGRLLLWLQKHPDVERREIEAPRMVQRGDSIEVKLSNALVKPSKAIWRSRNGEVLHGEESFLKGEDRLVLNAPPKAGYHQLTFEGVPGMAEIGVKGLQDEYWSDERRKVTLEHLTSHGWLPLKEGESPSLSEKGEIEVRERDSGWPFYRHPAYLLIWVLLLVAHWLITNRVLLGREGRK